MWTDNDRKIRACLKCRLQDDEELRLSMFVHRAIQASVQLHKFPKSIVDIFVVILDDCGGIEGPSVTAASLGLADAGIEVFDLVTGCSAVSLPCG